MIPPSIKTKTHYFSPQENNDETSKAFDYILKYRCDHDLLKYLMKESNNQILPPPCGCCNTINLDVSRICAIPLLDYTTPSLTVMETNTLAFIQNPQIISIADNIAQHHACAKSPSALNSRPSMMNDGFENNPMPANTTPILKLLAIKTLNSFNHYLLHRLEQDYSVDELISVCQDRNNSHTSENLFDLIIHIEIQQH
eukprot:TRINITY_DN677_c0_g2_i3.p1 TRINITY_DN677_c0_g2~~TRINITY_DN677_c0_g2_i3.p1  ORF type:complete len:198 (-),score=21.13 TRINITY_DN677_c0_g2_i3:1383-1976(-)